jgi:hypothetical protein
MKTRKEKISFLKGLIRGERSIHEIKPSRQIFLFRRAEVDADSPCDPPFDCYHEPATGKLWTAAEISEHEQENPQDRVFAIIIKRG